MSRLSLTDMQRPLPMPERLLAVLLAVVFAAVASLGVWAWLGLLGVVAGPPGY